LDGRGLSPYALARFTGLSLNTIYRLTRPGGRFRLIRADTIERLCGALRVTPSELFDYEEPSAPVLQTLAPSGDAQQTRESGARRAHV
jgi:DNA-binding Xre family transcriptional regulator